MAIVLLEVGNVDVPALMPYQLSGLDHDPVDGIDDDPDALAKCHASCPHPNCAKKGRCMHVDALL